MAIIYEWEKLSQYLQKDLAHHQVTKESWKAWNHGQRHRVLNARAWLMPSLAWNNVTSIVFGDLIRSSNPTFTPNPTKWFLAITTSKDIGPILEKSGWSTRWNPNHKENNVNLMSGNFGIVMHIGMLKPPSDRYSWIHWDAGGGWAFHPVHLYEVLAKTGTIDDNDVSLRIGKENLQ